MKSVETIARSSLLGTRTKEDINILGPRKKTQAETDKMADYLVDAFKAPDHRPAFLRIAWRLDTGTIHKMVGLARELGNQNPRGYFITSAKNEMKRRGVA